MRRAVFLITVSAALSVPVWAAEPGTYRPGQAYYSSPVSASEQCASQCQGDAQCKGWNFIRPRPASPTGVCELNAFQVSPVPSPISVSGDNMSVRSSSRIVPAGTNTIRVGAPAAAVTAGVRDVPTRQLTAKLTPPVQQRPIARPSQTAALGSPAPAQQSQLRARAPARSQAPQTVKARFNYQLDSAPAVRRMPAAKPAAAPQSKGSMAAASQTPAPHFRYSLDAGPSGSRGPAASARAPRPLTAPRHELAGRSPIPAVTASASAATAQIAETTPEAPTLRPPVVRPQRPVSRPHQLPGQLSGQLSGPPPTSSSVSHQSLFGSLHDDVSVTVPLSLTPQNLPSDPNAPIATVTSVRTKPVETRALAALGSAP